MKKLTILVSSIAVLAASFLFVGKAKAEDLTRLAGPDRYSTAVEVSKASYPVGTNDIVIVNGETFADSLAAAPLAYIAKAPILPIKKDIIPQVTWNEIQRVAKSPCFVSRNIYILGGTAVVNQAQEDFLVGKCYHVKRLAGKNRMETSVAVAKEVDKLRGKNEFRFYLVNGYRFPDGIAIGPLAALEKRVVLVTEDGDLSQVLRDYVNGVIASDPAALTDVTLVGGTVSIPQSVEDLFHENEFGVTRIAGANRYATAALIAGRIVNGVTQSTGTGIALADGDTFADALASGPFAAIKKYGLLLDQATPCGDTIKFLQAKQKVIAEGVVLGGVNAVSLSAEQVAEQVIGGAQPCK